MTKPPADTYAPDLFEVLYELRDRDRERKRSAMHIIRGRDVPTQLSRVGFLKWYMHPMFQWTSIRSLQVFIQEIPPASRSGREHIQGGRVMYILEGKGYTTVDGVRHDWEADDVVMLPIRPRGVVYQHFNLSADKPARYIAAEANLVDTLGPELGVSREVLETAPEYRGPAKP